MPMPPSYINSKFLTILIIKVSLYQQVYIYTALKQESLDKQRRWYC